MRVLISADAEGVTGVTGTDELLYGKPHYEFMRQMLTADVNAASREPSPAAHRGRRQRQPLDDDERLIEELDPAADLIKGFHKHLCMVEGVQAADAVFFLGYHCRPATPTASATRRSSAARSSRSG
jgi:D-amino peptidase